MSIYERAKQKQTQERIFRGRQNRVETLKDKCSVCGSYGSVDEPVQSYLGSDDIVYHYCIEHEYEVIKMSELPFNRDSVSIGKNFGV
jgi:hypothetical protein